MRITKKMLIEARKEVYRLEDPKDRKRALVKFIALEKAYVTQPAKKTVKKKPTRNTGGLMGSYNIKMHRF